jgi:hypothetical protein
MTFVDNAIYAARNDSVKRHIPHSTVYGRRGARP